MAVWHARMTVGELIAALGRFEPRLRVDVKGCDCILLAVEVVQDTEDSVLVQTL